MNKNNRKIVSSLVLVLVIIISIVLVSCKPKTNLLVKGFEKWNGLEKKAAKDVTTFLVNVPIPSSESKISLPVQIEVDRFYDKSMVKFDLKISFLEGVQVPLVSFSQENPFPSNPDADYKIVATPNWDKLSDVKIRGSFVVNTDLDKLAPTDTAMQVTRVSYDGLNEFIGSNTLMSKDGLIITNPEEELSKNIPEIANIAKEKMTDMKGILSYYKNAIGYDFTKVETKDVKDNKKNKLTYVGSAKERISWLIDLLTSLLPKQDMIFSTLKKMTGQRDSKAVVDTILSNTVLNDVNSNFIYEGKEKDIKDSYIEQTQISMTITKTWINNLVDGALDTIKEQAGAQQAQTIDNIINSGIRVRMALKTKTSLIYESNKEIKFS